MAERCEVWWATPGSERGWQLDLLDAGERRRWAALRRPEDRARFVVAVALLKLVAGRWLSRPAAEVTVRRDCASCPEPHGKPRIDGLFVSVSHSGGRVAVAVTVAGEVGVDVETLTGWAEDLPADQVVGPGEWLDPADPHAFHRMWTRKEAVLKATGDGLTVPMTGVILTPAGLLAYPGRAAFPVQLLDLDAGAGHVGALAVLTDREIELGEHEAEQLLAEPESGPERKSRDLP